MPNRRLRIVKKSPPPASGVCERCNAQFKSNLPNSMAEIKALFLIHKCKPMDSGQNALPIVCESTEGK